MKNGTEEKIKGAFLTCSIKMWFYYLIYKIVLFFPKLSYDCFFPPAGEKKNKVTRFL